MSIIKPNTFADTLPAYLVKGTQTHKILPVFIVSSILSASLDLDLQHNLSYSWHVCFRLSLFW